MSYLLRSTTFSRQALMKVVPNNSILTQVLELVKFGLLLIDVKYLASQLFLISNRGDFLSQLKANKSELFKVLVVYNFGSI